MKSILIAVIIILAAIVVYQFLTRKPPEYPIGPTQVELDEFKTLASKQVTKLKNENDSLIASHRHDSTMRANQIKQDKKIIKNLTDRANSLLAQLNDSTPCCEASEIKSSVIALKDSVNARQAERIVNDSFYIQNLQSNFDRRLAIEQQQRKLLEEENIMQAGVIEELKAELPKQRKKGFWNGLKIGAPSGAVIALILLL